MTASVDPPDASTTALIFPSGFHVASQGESTSTANGAPPAERRSAPAWSDVPWRTILACIGSVLGTAVAIVVIYKASRVVVWVSISGFFALVLGRPVRWLERRFRVGRGLAVGIVLLLTIVSVGGLLAVFVVPLRQQLVTIATDLPGTVQQAAAGKGQFGRLLARLGLQSLVQQNQDELIRGASSIEKAAPGYVGSVLQSVLAVVTVMVTTCLMLSQSALLSRASLRVVPIRHRALVAQVGRDASSAVSGYMTGNLLISACAGLFGLVTLTILGVPSPVVLALWVAFADLIPLVGATLGAIAAVIAAFFVSPTVGIVALVAFVLYQQFENSVLQTVIMSRTVRVNPLVVLLSVLIGVELFGFVGALLAVPLAGATSVIIKEMWQHRPSARNELVIVRNQESRPRRTRSSRRLSFGKR